MKKKFTQLVEFTGERPSIFVGEKKYVSTGALKHSYISEDDIEMIEYNTRPSRANLQVSEGDIIFAKMAFTDKKLIIDQDSAKNIYSTGFFAVKPRNGVITKECLYYLLSSNTFSNQKNRNSTGATQKAITNKGLEKVNVSIPNYEIQNAVTSKLDRLDEIIGLKKKQLKEYDQLIKSRFVDLFGEHRSNNKNFKVVKLDKLTLKITDGKHGGCGREEGSGYYFIGAREIFDNGIHYENAPEIPFVDFEKDYRRCNVENGDFVIVNTGATIGKSAIANHELTDRTLLQKSVALIKCKVDILKPRFLQYYYISNPELYLVKSASAQPNLLLSQIKKTNINLPPIELQNEFVEFVKHVDKLKFEVQKSLDETQTLFDSLMQEYFG